MIRSLEKLSKQEQPPANVRKSKVGPEIPVVKKAGSDAIIKPSLVTENQKASKWFSIPSVMFLLHFFTEATYGRGSELVPIYLLTVAAMSAVLPAALLLLQKDASNGIARALKFVGVVMLMFWGGILPLVWIGFVKYTHPNPRGMLELSIAIFIGAAILSTLYVKFVEKRE